MRKRYNSELLPAYLRADSTNLDLIRAVAVLCVACHHLFRLTSNGTDFTWLVGHMGVLIFFVHTALVLMLSLERSAQRLSGSALAVDFYVRRWFRIYPLSIVFVTAAFFEIVPSREEPWSWPTYLSNLALTTNLTYSEDMWTVLWTLPLEVQMYIVLPVAFVWLRGRTVAWAVVAWLFAVLGALIQPHISDRLTVLAYAPCFIGGVVAWRLLHASKPRWAGLWWPWAFLASWSVWLIAPRQEPEFYRWAFCLTLGVLIPMFHDLQWQPLTAVAKWIARYSYGIYLSHLPVMVFALTFEGPIRWMLLIGLGTAVPIVLFHTIEKPLMDAGRRVAKRLTAERPRIGFPAVAGKKTIQPMTPAT